MEWIHYFKSEEMSKEIKDFIASLSSVRNVN